MWSHWNWWISVVTVVIYWLGGVAHPASRTSSCLLKWLNWRKKGSACITSNLWGPHSPNFWTSHFFFSFQIVFRLFVLVFSRASIRLLINRLLERYSVYVKRQTRICTTWQNFPHYFWLFIISTHELVVSRNFLSIRIVLSCFYVLFFFILRNSQFEPDFCLLPYTQISNSLLTDRTLCMAIV